MSLQVKIERLREYREIITDESLIKQIDYILKNTSEEIKELKSRSVKTYCKVLENINKLKDSRYI